MSKRPPAADYPDAVAFHLASLRAAGPKRRARMRADPVKTLRKSLRLWNDSAHPTNRTEKVMPLARTTKRNDPTPEQSAAEREVAAMLAELEAVAAADLAELRELAATPGHDPEQAARFAYLAELRKARRRLEREAEERERLAAERYDRKAENAAWLARQPKGGREAYLMLARFGHPLTRKERERADEARRLAAEARDAERAQVLARLDAARDELDPAAKLAPQQATPTAENTPPATRRKAPRVTFLNLGQ